MSDTDTPEIPPTDDALAMPEPDELLGGETQIAAPTQVMPPQSPPEAQPEAEPPALPGARAPLPAFVMGGLLIAVGLILIWPLLSGGYTLVPGAILAIVLVGIGLLLLGYWLSSGRQARGALFLAVLGLLWAGLTGVYLLEPGMRVTESWPLYIAALGSAVLLSFAGDKNRDRRLILPGVVFTAAGLIALVVTQGILPPDVLDFARQAAPWIGLALLGGMLPLAFRRVPVEQ